MVTSKISKKRNGSSSNSRADTMATITILLMLVVFLTLNHHQTKSMQRYSLDGSSSDPQRSSSAENNKRAMKEWRNSSKNQCRELIEQTTSIEKKEVLERSFVGRIGLNPMPSTVSASKGDPYRRCRNAFIDLGTNIGDSVGYFVDNAIDVCSTMWVDANPGTKVNANFPRPHLDVTTLDFKHRGSKPNPLFGMLQKLTKGVSTATSESFCVYGMEGNPVFTERLTKLENFISDMNPRPVEHVHIFTESVATAVNGPTKLYLDKTSVEQNFWGSSILSSQQDAVKSANELNDGNVFSADVTGINLSTMVQSTMLALKENVSPEDQSGGILIVKVDIEGAEYQILKEVAASGVLCNLTELGNQVVLVVEYHNMSITDAKERQREKDGHKEAVRKLEGCGVEFKKLSASWA